MISEVFDELVRNNLMMLSAVTHQDYELDIRGDQYQVLSGSSSVTEYMPLDKMWNWLSKQFDLFYSGGLRKSGRIRKRVTA